MFLTTQRGDLSNTLRGILLCRMASTGGTYLFVEAHAFTSAVKEYFGSDESYASFQGELAGQPDKGPVIPGASPL